jgi:hypothetical protein
MTERRTSHSEVTGFEEIDGGLYVCLEKESVPILNKNGQKVIVANPLIRERLFGPAIKDDFGQMRHEDNYNAWRQGP